MAIKETLTRVCDIYADSQFYGGKTVRLGGWIKTIRSSNAFGFIELNDIFMPWLIFSTIQFFLSLHNLLHHL